MQSFRAFGASLLLWLLAAYSPLAQQLPPFINFETATVHALDLSPSGSLLAACNLPDGHVEFFHVSETGLTPAGSVPVGVDPVSVRFRTENELWVVNYISQSINIVDTRDFRVTGVIQTTPRPGDVVFAGEPERAFVSGTLRNLVEVFDPKTRQPITNLIVLGQRPTALAVSADKRFVYCAIKESGNYTTILTRKLTNLHNFSQPGAIEDPNGPYGGQNPPPNSGNEFSPALNPDFGTNQAPPVGLIVKKQANGRWTDDNNRDWTEYIRGTNAHLSGRIEGWDMLDHDLVRVNAGDLSIQYGDSLITMGLGLGVNPANGTVGVVGTEHLNHIRFEPNLRGIFARVNLATYDFASNAKTIRDLNPHLDYKTASVPAELSEQSVGDPRAILWNREGTTLYIAARGSDCVLVLNSDGTRSGRLIDVPEGPEALALDERHNRLYVLSRFASSISVIDLESREIVQTLRLPDPTPAPIRIGRKFLYNTRETSGLGHVACATCHVDARTDRLAWDLGDPAGELTPLAPRQRQNLSRPPLIAPPDAFHPMKGPMLTQSLQDIIGKEPFHWRGDRLDISEFDVTYRDLQGTEHELIPSEMTKLKALLSSIYFPPNPNLNLNGTLAKSLPLDGYYSPSEIGDRSGPPIALAVGNPSIGRTLFEAAACSICHAAQSGYGIRSSSATNHILRSAILEREESKLFKISQFRTLEEREGFDLGSTNSTSGFGLLHDGRADSLARFIREGTDQPSDSLLFSNDPALAHLLAFLLSSSSSVQLYEGASRVPVASTFGAPAALGRQLQLTPSRLTDLRLELSSPNGGGPLVSLDDGVALIVRGPLRGIERSWLWVWTGFQSDRRAESHSLNQLEEMISTNPSFTAFIVTRGAGNRLALDRDLDGHFNQDELDAGSNPADPMSLPQPRPALAARLTPGASISITWNTVPAARYRLETSETITGSWALVAEIQAESQTATHLIETLPGERRYFRVVRLD